MRLPNIQAIVLAAGKSTRLNTGTTKHIEKICGQEMILYQTKLLEAMGIPTTVVVGYQKEYIQETIIHHHPDDVHFTVQKEQCGTGHAILCAEESWKQENILIMNGNVPLVTQDIIQALYKKHLETNATITFAIAHNADPSGAKYNRVIKNDKNVKVIKADAFKGELYEHCWIDGSIYLVTKKFLEDNKNAIDHHDEQVKEFCVTDLINLAHEQQKTITTVSVPFDQIRGVNTYEEFWAAEQVKRSELIRYWMSEGVRFGVAQNVHIHLDVTIGSGTFIGCGAHITSGTKIGKNCTIDSFSSIENSILENNVTINSHCIVKDSHIKSNTHIGPFAHIQEKTTLEQNTTVGNFVEIKRSTLGTNTKAKHLTYIGDTTIGKNVNIGAGTIVCNYDGQTKHATTIQDNVFIGSNNTLVAPVTIKKDSYTAAGSTITQNVPEKTLALGRARQVNKEGYTKTAHTKKEKKLTADKKKSKFSFVGAIKTDNDTTPPEAA